MVLRFNKNLIVLIGILNFISVNAFAKRFYVALLVEPSPGLNEYLKHIPEKSPSIGNHISVTQFEVEDSKVESTVSDLSSSLQDYVSKQLKGKDLLFHPQSLYAARNWSRSNEGMVIMGNQLKGSLIQSATNKSQTKEAVVEANSAFDQFSTGLFKALKKWNKADKATPLVSRYRYYPHVTVRPNISARRIRNSSLTQALDQFNSEEFSLSKGGIAFRVKGFTIRVDGDEFTRKADLNGTTNWDFAPKIVPCLDDSNFPALSAAVQKTSKPVSQVLRAIR